MSKHNKTGEISEKSKWTLGSLAAIVGVVALAVGLGKVNDYASSLDNQPNHTSSNQFDTDLEALDAAAKTLGVKSSDVTLTVHRLKGGQILDEYGAQVGQVYHTVIGFTSDNNLPNSLRPISVIETDITGKILEIDETSLPSTGMQKINGRDLSNLVTVAIESDNNQYVTEIVGIGLVDSIPHALASDGDNAAREVFGETFSTPRKISSSGLHVEVTQGNDVVTSIVTINGLSTQQNVSQPLKIEVPSL